MSDRLLTTRQVAERWQQCPETVLRQKRKGLLPFVTLPSGVVRFRLADVEQVEAPLCSDSQWAGDAQTSPPRQQEVSPDAL